MSDMTLFMNKVRVEKTLQNQIGNAFKSAGASEIVPRFIAIAKEHGYTVSDADLLRYFDNNKQEKLNFLSNDMLAGIVGGRVKDTEDKAWWEYVVDTLDAVAKGLGHCFSVECLVSTPDGAKAIREIKAGDEVISLNNDGSRRIAKVIDVIEPREYPITEVTFTDGRKWNATKTQWFYCGDDEYACVMDDQGKKALTIDGESVGVENVVETGQSELVYDFVVEGLNVMFVNGIAAEGFSLS